MNENQTQTVCYIRYSSSMLNVNIIRILLSFFIRSATGDKHYMYWIFEIRNSHHSSKGPYKPDNLTEGSKWNCQLKVHQYNGHRLCILNLIRILFQCGYSFPMRIRNYNEIFCFNFLCVSRLLLKFFNA